MTAAIIPAARRRSCAPRRGTIFRAGRPKRARRGRYIGIGLAHGIKGTGRGPFEFGNVRVSPTGHITVSTGAAPMGQGLATALAQICADAFGVRAQDVTVIAGDTAAAPLGLGGFASRQTVTAGSSVQIAAQAVAAKARKLASHMLEAAEEDLEIVDGEVRVVGAPQLAVKLGELARVLKGAPGYGFPQGIDPGLEASATFRVDQACLFQRLPCRRGRGRYRDRRRTHPALHRDAGFRPPRQSA